MKKTVISKETIKKIETVTLVLIIIILAVLVGYGRIENSNFNAINGDFQNYNPVRRFLAGQIPFKDFAVYLGTGHLLVFSLFQFIIGNDFTKSLFVSNMLAMLSAELMMFTITYLIQKDKKQVLYYF